MSFGSARTRLNIYLEPPQLQESIKIAAARHRVSLSNYCLEAIRRRLAEDGLIPVALREDRSKARAAVESLDRLRSTIMTVLPGPGAGRPSVEAGQRAEVSFWSSENAIFPSLKTTPSSYRHSMLPPSNCS